uniref:Non-specific serine/threonine protein kinase (EC) n=1 Tax=Ganoderma boninense TaxID=34458 RepID=A0A5K1JUH2_9APHY|nr:Non-specific serine/threonine protein kinase (EC [Ganoderma boninense]
MLSETPSLTCPNPILTQEYRIETVVIDSLGEVPAALRLFQAIKHASALGAIGYCPSKVEALAARIADEELAELSLDDVDREGDHGYAGLTDEDKDREARNSETIVALREIATSHARTSASGILDKPFRLRINRRGIKFDEDIPPRAKSSLSYGSLPAATVTALEPRLEKWHSNAKVSGYGDVREQVTKVDKNVRQAKEIPASEFSIDPELLERIADIWDQNFFPNSGVRVEPYKINLYGPGGHFAVHRDTPQQGLVGTFLLGLGDTANYGGLTLDGEIRPAYEGHWTAFYPDVPHKVEELDGYRAAIAFKLFRTEAENANAKETDTSVAVRKQVSQLVGSMEAPFGILLQRKYCLGTTVFSGFDAVLVNAARALPGVEVEHLPIILQSSANWSDPNSEYADSSSYDLKCSTAVYPFTKGHVEALIEYVEHSTAKPANHSACGAPWLEGVEGVPFFSLDLEQSLFTYQEDLHDTSVYLGNEVEMCREDSIYLSYALLVLPSADESSKSGDDDDSE